MDFVFEKEWRETVKEFENIFGPDLDLQSILFLIGIQEIGKGSLKLTKDQKVEVIHVAVCTLLTQFGYYEIGAIDVDGWPHFERTEKVFDKSVSEERLLKEAIVSYKNNWVL